MRITESMYYKNLYANNNSKLSTQLFDVNKQIASGLKIQYAQDDVRIFSETMRLDNEVIVLEEIEKSVQSGFKLSDQTDLVLNEFETGMNRIRKLLVNASNGTHSPGSLDSIAQELRGIESHMKNLANSSINGQFLFSGSMTDTKPIDENGIYQGDDKLLEAFTGSGVRQAYSLSGAELFLGEEKMVNREITTNVHNRNLIASYAALQPAGYVSSGSHITASSTIRELMGDSDNAVDAVTNKHFFYITGTKSSGETFEQKISLKDTDTVGSLLTQIGNLYGNTADTKVLDVNLNQFGEIVLTDRLRGSSKLDFHMVGAVDLSGGAAANVNSIDALGVGESDFDKIMLATSLATNPNLHVKEFIKSSMTSADGVAATNILQGTVYDRVEFAVNGASLSSNVAQVEKGTNVFATNSTKLVDVTSGATLNGKQFTFEGTNINGVAFSATIDLANAGSSFTVGGNTYNIYNADAPRAAVDADKMTYRQLMDVMNMVTTNSLPVAAPGSAAQYDSAVTLANTMGNTYLSYDGKVSFMELAKSSTSASIAIYDSNSGDFSNPPSVLSFNANNALTIRDAKTDFFASLDMIISSVEKHSSYPDASVPSARNVGIENAIAMMDDLQDHVFKSHSKVGSQTNSLSLSVERVQMLKISTQTLRSSVIDTDVAESQLKLSQLKLNYEAMLSTVSKISQLSLVNYL